MKITVKELAAQIDAEFVGDGNSLITGVGPVEAAKESDVTFISSDKHVAELSESQAAAVIVRKHIENLDKPQLIVKNVNAALIEALKVFAPVLKGPAKGIDPGAVIASSAKIGPGVSIGPQVVVEGGAEIGQNSIIGSGCKIGENSKIGDGSRLDSNVVVYHNCIIGNNVIIQANTTIGATGFGYSFIDGAHRLIPHNGSVVIEDFVEIGANTCIDRAKFGNTVVGAGTKIDNFVQIAHNVIIGKCCLLAAQVGISGSCRLGDGVVLAGRSGASDNVQIGDGAILGGQSVAFHDIPAGAQFFGIPAIEKKQAIKSMGLTKRLPKFIEQLKQLCARVEKLEAAKDDTK